MERGRRIFSKAGRTKRSVAQIIRHLVITVTMGLERPLIRKARVTDSSVREASFFMMRSSVGAWTFFNLSESIGGLWSLKFLPES